MPCIVSVKVGKQKHAHDVSALSGPLLAEPPCLHPHPVKEER